MAHPDVVYGWQQLPEYHATRQLARTIGRLLMSMPPALRRISGRAFMHAPVLIARGIAGANADMPPGDDLTREEREAFRSSALEGVELLRSAFRLLRSKRLGSQADLLVGLVLLERIEQRVSRSPP